MFDLFKTYVWRLIAYACLLAGKGLQLTAILLILSGISFSQEITNVSVETIRDVDYVTVELAEIIEPKVFKLREPNRLVADFYGAVWDGGKRIIDVNTPRILKVRWAQNSVRPDVVRIVIDLINKEDYEISKDLNANKIIIKIGRSGQKENVIAASPLDERISKIPEEKIPVNIIASTSESSFSQINPEMAKIIPPDNMNVPDLWKIKKFSVFVNGEEIKLGRKPLFIKNTLFVPANDLFVLCGLEVRFDAMKKAIYAKNNDMEIIIEAGKDNIHVNGFKAALDGSAKNILGRLYVPLVSSVRAMGFGANFDETKNILYILPRITKISWQDINGEKNVIIEANRKITTFEVEKSNKTLFLKINIPNFILDADNSKISINENGIKGIKAVQNVSGVKIGIYAQPKPEYRILQSDKSISIKFPSALRSLRVSEEAEVVNLKVFSTGSIEPVIKQLSDPDRIIIDIPNSVYNLRQNTDVNVGGVLRIRGSQYSSDPLWSRIVIDLAAKLGYTKIISEDKKSFSLSIEKKEIVIARARHLKIFKNKIIVIDPGHGGDDPGAFGFSGENIKEKELTLSTSFKLEKMLADAGAIVFMTRENDETLSLKSRVEFGANNRADLLICMHYNSHFKPDTTGTETYYYNANSKLLGEIIHKSMLDNLGRQDRKLSKVKFYVIYNSQMPTVLIEPVYISNREEEKLAIDPEFQEKIAKSIYDGIKHYLEILQKIG